MAPRYTQTPDTPKRKSIPVAPQIGERRDAKHESSLCDAMGGVRRPLALALMADRKR
jgi:hypothetical protein